VIIFKILIKIWINLSFC